ncbi:MAG: chemotaxis response regulator protein-glutamate methylesterase [Marinobacter sp.]|uniref:protein-glutamate methylesterase/protein-glutamine glutaminase n=1 Tax=Marinobacter sp. TaxID=50741 RepID=UPI00299ED10F|nr:chemotaxis response regulator protein-glutamate methylesterase [Marinobacter sp.]MDX1756109.1 chemotaxis response regulator protein-glutamate methylesterase [Marinobacter sp.]
MAITVLVVDDSALIRQVLGEMIRTAPGFQLVGTANDAYAARDLVNEFAPDVITLDIEMPRMDGLSFLARLMKARPTPVVMVSTLTESGADATLKALELGAVDFVTKPKLDIKRNLEQYRQELLEKLRAAAIAGEAVRRSARKPPVPGKPLTTHLSVQGTEHLVAIGASTGGTEAIKSVLAALPVGMPGIVMTQHMPPGFTRSFAERLDRLCRIRVLEAQGGERILPGHAYLAPGDRHLLVDRSGADLVCKLSDAPPVNRHRPAVDAMFDSVARVCSATATGVLLTGMGKDGAQGLLTMHQRGARTLAQDERSCVVYGMPREAVRLEAVDEVLPLPAIPAALVEHIKRVSRGNRV